jgi:hypothetical protein
VAGKKNRSGRHPKLDAAIQKVIVDSIATGVPRKYAAQRAGIDESTLRLWCSKGRKGGRGSEIYIALLAAIKKAEADAVARNVALIQQAASKSWQAAAWWLERRYHADFGRRDKTILQAGKKGPNLGEDVRERLREADGGGTRQPGQAGGAGTADVADPAPPAADQ